MALGLTLPEVRLRCHFLLSSDLTYRAGESSSKISMLGLLCGIVADLRKQRLLIKIALIKERVDFLNRDRQQK